MHQIGSQNGVKIELKVGRSGRRRLPENVSKISSKTVWKLAAQGIPKSRQNLRKFQKNRSSNTGLFPDGSPRAPKDAPGTILDQFLMICDEFWVLISHRFIAASPQNLQQNPGRISTESQQNPSKISTECLQNLRIIPSESQLKFMRIFTTESGHNWPRTDRRLGGWVQPGNRFVSSVRAYARCLCLVRSSSNSHSGRFPFSLFVFFWDAFPFPFEELSES